MDTPVRGENVKTFVSRWDHRLQIQIKTSSCMAFKRVVVVDDLALYFRVRDSLLLLLNINVIIAVRGHRKKVSTPQDDDVSSWKNVNERILSCERLLI